MSALSDFMQRKLGIAAEKWNEKLGSTASDETAMERKLGTRIDEWWEDFGGTEPVVIGDGFTADSTLLFADSTLVTADVAA